MRTDLTLTTRVSRNGETVRLDITGTVGRLAVRGSVRDFNVVLYPRATLQHARDITSVYRTEGGELPFGAHRAVVERVYLKLNTLAAQHRAGTLASEEGVQA